MQTYTVNEFRRHMREALNIAEAGGAVIVVRHGKRFIIKLEG